MFFRRGANADYSHFWFIYIMGQLRLTKFLKKKKEKWAAASIDNQLVCPREIGPHEPKASGRSSFAFLEGFGLREDQRIYASGWRLPGAGGTSRSAQ